jgi:uncharacterized protein YkwD
MRIHTSIVLLLLTLTSRGHAQPVKVVDNDSSFISSMLQQHNSCRAEANLPGLSWSSALAGDAAKWAKHLAKIDKGEHDMSIRGQEGENLWWGTAGAYSYTEMVGYWRDEKSSFVYGTYPNCSTSRSAIVGHYTQIVWKNTQSVGCAFSSNGKTDFLVCRYSPAGNIIGENPY